MYKKKDTTITSYLISEEAAKKLDSLHKKYHSKTKSFLINEAILAYDKAPESYKFDVWQEIGEKKRTIGVVFPVSTKNLLFRYRQERGFYYSRFINALILHFPFEDLDIKDPDPYPYMSEYYQKSSKRNRHSDFSPSQILQQADATVGEMDKLLKMFLGSEKTSQEAE